MQKKIAVIALASFAVLLLAGCSIGSADKQGKTTPTGNEQQKSGEKKQGNAPAEITTACSNKNEGDACEVTMSQGGNKMSGTCKKAPQGDQLSCMPEGEKGEPGGPGGQKPTEE